MQLFNSLWEQMRSQGFVVDSKNVSFTGEYTRFPRDSSGLNGWLRIDYDEKLNYARAEYGDWKSGEKYSWTSDSETERDHERDAEIAAFLAKRQEENEKRKLEGYAAAREEATKIVTTFDESPSPYLGRKGLAGLEIPGGGTRAGVLYVPAYSEAGLAGFQKILPDGGKYFQPGMEIRGSFCPLPALGDDLPARIFVAEGIATAGSIWKAFDGAECVVACFNAGNMKAVVQTLKAHGRGAQVIACGDEDILTKVRGQWHNPGRLAALGCGADKVVFPDYTGAGSFYGSDFNDMHQFKILELVRETIEEQLVSGPNPEPTHLRPPAPGSTGESQGEEEGGSGAAEAGEGGGPESLPAGERLPALPRREGKNGPQKPTQQRVARALQDHHGLNLIKSGEDVFQWVGTHWKLCEQGDYDAFFRQAMAFAGFDFKAGEVNAIVEIFLKSIAHVPPGVNLFESRPDRANFSNGTLHLVFRPKTASEMAQSPESGTQFLSTEFREHSREDYCNSCVPLYYKPHQELEANADFEQMMKSLWPGAESAEKIRLYKQVLGSALLPMFPKIFFFLGKPQTGKSTALMIIRKLLAEENVSSVDPTKWGKEFYLEPMAGKLANIHMDIDTKRRLDDSVLKNVIDRAVFQINRKGRTIVKAMLPAFHAFGANDMPPSLDANSGAFNRRMIIVQTDTRQAGSGGGGEFSAWVWGRGPEGILKAALEGLEDLLARGGNFVEPESSKQEKDDWGRESDYLGQFLAEAELGGIKVAGKNLTVKVGEGLEIEKATLWQCFLEYCHREQIDHRINGPIVFSRALKKKGPFGERRDNTARYWTGIGLCDGSGAGGDDEKPSQF